MVAALALLAAAACSSGGADKGTAGANPTLATDPPRTNPTLATVPAPTTTTNPYAVPAVIDAAYVNKVLAGLDAITGDAVRRVMASRTIPRDVFDRLKALYLDTDRLQRAIDGFQLDLRDNMAGYRATPGNKITTVTELVSASSTCIFSRVRRNYEAVTTGTVPPVDPQWIALRQSDPTRDPNRYNTTGWAYIYDGYSADRSRPVNPCAN